MVYADHLIIDGHQRLTAAIALGASAVPVIFVELSDERVKLLSLALNKISGDWDEQLLARQLADLAAIPYIDLSSTGFDQQEVSTLLRSLQARERRERPETFDLTRRLMTPADTRPPSMAICGNCASICCWLVTPPIRRTPTSSFGRIDRV